MANFAGQTTLRMSTTINPAVHNYRTQAFTASSPGSATSLTASANQPFELAAGATVALKTSISISGSTGTGPLNVTVAVYDDAGAQVLAPVTVFSQAAAGTGNFTGTDVTFTPATAGTFEIRIRAVYGPDGINGSYDATSAGALTLSGTPNVWVSPATEASKGYVRAGTSVTAASESNVSPGGAVPATWTYPDKAFSALTLGVAPQVATAVTFSEGARSNSPSITTRAANDSTGLGPLDKTDLGGARTGNVVVKAAPANAVLSGRPAFHFTSAPAGWTLGAVDGGSASTGAASVTSPNLVTDVGIRFQHYLQNDDSTYPPPGSVNSPPSQTVDITHGVMSRLTSNLGFVLSRLTNARNEVVGGITYTRHLQDNGHLVADVANDSVTNLATGWGPSYITWSAQLPGGSWTHQNVISAPSGLVGMEVGGSGTLSLLAVNPNVRVICGLDIPSDTADADHWSPGLALLLGLVVVNFANDKPVTVDASPSPTVLVGRFNVSLGRAEYLAADFTWQSLNPGPAYEFPLTQSAGDPTVWTITLTAAATAGFSYDGLILIGKAYVNGTPYTGPSQLEVTATANKHSGYAFDAVAFATGKFSFQ